MSITPIYRKDDDFLVSRWLVEDAGTFESLLRAANLVAQSRQTNAGSRAAVNA